MSRKRAPAEEQSITPRRREQNERAEDGAPRTQPPSNEVTSTKKTRTTIPYLLRVFVFRCDARNRNHRDTHESKPPQNTRIKALAAHRESKRNRRLGNRQSQSQCQTPPKMNGGHRIRDARHLKESRAELKGREGRLRGSDYFSSQGLFADAERAAMRPQTMFSALLPPEMP